MKRIKHPTPGSLEETLATLPQVARTELLEYWEVHYGTPAPAHISTGLLLRAVAYRLQEKVYGGLKPTTRRYLESVVRDTAMGKKPTAIATIKPGTRIIREWRGTTYEVIVQSEGNGVLLNGEHLSSLTEAAHRITGAKWSGPRFFGIVRGGKDAA